MRAYAVPSASRSPAGFFGAFTRTCYPAPLIAAINKLWASQADVLAPRTKHPAPDAGVGDGIRRLSAPGARGPGLDLPVGRWDPLSDPPGGGAACTLVLLRARPDGAKEVIALAHL